MKRTTKFIKSALALAATTALALLASCSTDTPDYPDNSSLSSLSGEVNESLTAYDAVTVENVSVDLPSDYIRGFDASAVDYYEQNKKINGGSAWYDTDRTQKEFFQILKAHGVNTVRLRIWNNPVAEQCDADGTTALPDGDNTLARTLKMAKRVKDAGLKLMIDFHYSDSFADPLRQQVPAAWKDDGSVEEVASHLKAYTKNVLSSLKSLGCSPEYVQVGNEINGGILLYSDSSWNSNYKKLTGSTSFTHAGKDNNLVTYLSAGCEAVREICPNAKIVLHVTSSVTPSSCLSAISSVDFDIIGLSYYPWEEKHGTIESMKNNISTWKATYNKDVIIAETSAYGDSDANSDEKAQSGGLKYENEHMINPKTAAVYTDLDLATGKAYMISSLQNQTNILRHIIEESVDSGAIGVFAWGGETGDWSHGMFSWKGQAYPSLAVFGVQGGSSLGVGESTYTPPERTMTLKLTFSEDIGATSVSVTYYNDSELTSDTVTADVIDNTATLKLSDAYANSYLYENAKLEVTGSYTSDITLSSSDSDFGGKTSKFWFKFDTDGTLEISCTGSNTGGGY